MIFTDNQSEGSFTVEAALLIPFCFFALMSFTCLFQMIRRQNDIQMGLLRSVEAYGNQGEKLASVDVLASNHVLLRWKEQGEDMICYIYDRTKIPFLGSRFFSLRRYQQMIANDYQGVSMVTEGSGGEKVYVAENGMVYHRDRECTYLRTKIRAVDVQDTWGLRNQSGGKYYPCETCCDSIEQEKSATVYIAGYGERYHIYSSCPRLKRSVRQVYLFEVGSLAPCSKCGGK